MERKILFIMLAITSVLLIIFLNYDNILKWRYNLAIKNKDCEQIYDLIEIENGKYLTKENFITQCKSKINDYKNYDLQVENHKIKNNLVNVYNNITVYIPSDSSLYLDNKLISSDLISDEDNLYNKFTFDKLYEGSYNISFRNNTKKEEHNMTISANDSVHSFEYNNPKQKIVVIGFNECKYCRDLLDFLYTIDSEIIEIKYYDVNNEYSQDIIRVKQDFLDYFHKEPPAWPTVVIGDQYIVGFGKKMEQVYINNIYRAYRNEIKTVIN